MLKKFRMPLLALTMAMSLFCMMSSPAMAGLIPSIPSSAEMAGQNRAAEIDKIQKVLEMQIVIDE